MVRPLYEKKAHLKTELEAKELLEHSWKVSLNKLPYSYAPDWLAFDGDDARAWVEYKNRKHRHDTFPNYLVSLRKWMSLRDLSEKTMLPSLLTVEFTDTMLCYRHYPNDISIIHIAWAGRTDRGDEQDMEPCAMIPMRLFTPFTEKGIREKRQGGGSQVLGGKP